MKNCFGFFTKAICMVLFLGTTTTSFAMVSNETLAQRSKYANRKEFITIDQKVGHFKGFGKPWLTIYKRDVNELDMMICGYVNPETGRIEQFKDYGTNFATITPIRFTIKLVDTAVPVQIDKIYKGWRESYIGKGLETLFKSIRILPNLEYPGTLFVDEYQECIPMKWVFKDINDFRGLKSYLKNKFAEKQIVPLSDKPLLLIKFDKINQKFEEEDLNFLETYYEILDPTDPMVKKFFETTQEAIDEARDNTKDAKVILDSYGEMFMRTVEGAAWDFKGKELIIYGTAAIVLALTVDLLKDYVKERCIKPIKEKVIKTA